MSGRMSTSGFSLTNRLPGTLFPQYTKPTAFNVVAVCALIEQHTLIKLEPPLHTLVMHRNKGWIQVRSSTQIGGYQQDVVQISCITGGFARGRTS